jgi:hypothetical protein
VILVIALAFELVAPAAGTRLGRQHSKPFQGFGGTLAKFLLVDSVDLGPERRIGREIVDVGEESVKHGEDVSRPISRVLLVKRQEHDFELLARDATVNQQSEEHGIRRSSR